MNIGNDRASFDSLGLKAIKTELYIVTSFSKFNSLVISLQIDNWTLYRPFISNGNVHASSQGSGNNFASCNDYFFVGVGAVDIQYRHAKRPILIQLDSLKLAHCIK